MQITPICVLQFYGAPASTKHSCQAKILIGNLVTASRGASRSITDNKLAPALVLAATIVLPPTIGQRFVRLLALCVLESYLFLIGRIDHHPQAKIPKLQFLSLG